MENWKKYRNLSGNSTVRFYQIGNDYINIVFPPDKKGMAYVYTYDYQTTGKIHIDIMKKLAENGSGLAGYINKKENGISKKYKKKILTNDLVEILKRL